MVFGVVDADERAGEDVSGEHRRDRVLMATPGDMLLPMSRLAFPRRLRLVRKRDFDAVYRDGARAAAGPLVAWGIPNDLGHPRLGLAVPRRAGTAVARNRLRRLIRESFRLLRHELFPANGPAAGYDLVVGVRRRETMTADECAAALRHSVQALQRAWSKRTKPG